MRLWLGSWWWETLRLESGVRLRRAMPIDLLGGLKMMFA
jgi:hypothetical protein